MAGHSADFYRCQDVIAGSRTTDKATPAERWYFFAGAMESETMVAEVAAMVKIFRQYPQLDVTYQINAGGVHDEGVWKNYFPEFYNWMIGEKPAELFKKKAILRLTSFPVK